MSPIIDQQRRLVEVGRIRLGDQVAYEQGGQTKRRAHKLDKFRLTSKDEVRLRAAAKLWGGEVRPWEARPGEWELYTEVDSLPIMLLPQAEPSLWYEHWSAGGCQRRCDGVSEQISDGPCQCEPEERLCKPHLRFPVLLPEIAGIGSWLVTSTGWNAANEVPATYALLQKVTAQGVLLPARLRLEQRTDVKEGQTRRFVVPVIDIDVALRELVYHTAGVLPEAEQGALPAGYKPIENGSEPEARTVAEAIAATEAQELRRTRRSAPPIPEQPDFSFQVTGATEGVVVEAVGGTAAEVLDAEPAKPAPAPEPEPAPASDEGTVTDPEPEPEPGPAEPEPAKGKAPADPPKPTKRQLDKLNLLVGKLRETMLELETTEGEAYTAPVLTTEQLWQATARRRNVADVDEMPGWHILVELLGGRDEEGVLHWSPLRDSLTRQEASDLIDSLEGRARQYNVEEVT